MTPQEHATATIKPTFLFFFFGTMLTRITATWIWPDMLDFLLAICVGGMVSAFVYLAAFYVSALMPFVVLPGIVPEQEPEPLPPVEPEPQRETRQVEQVARPEPMATQSRSIPDGVGDALRALDSGEIVSPVSLAQLDDIGISRSYPRPESKAHVVLQFLAERGIIDDRGNVIQLPPTIDSIPHPADF